MKQEKAKENGEDEHEQVEEELFQPNNFFIIVATHSFHSIPTSSTTLDHP